MNGRHKVPSMKQIQRVKGTNGYNIVSTFSGCGGSCLGYEMAGYNVLYANEFIPEAQRTYRANHKGVYLDTRDIRMVQPEDILRITKLKKGELDLFDGSPPCSSFSTAGSREKGWGKIKKYSDTEQRTDDLFFQYIRILKGLMPKTFIAENVKGIALGKAKGMLKEIMKQMEEAGYIVTAQIIDAQYLGVPQHRERCILIGVRKDIGIQPPKIKPLDYIVTLGDALKDVQNNQEEVDVLLHREARKEKSYKVVKALKKNPRRRICGSDVTNGSWFNMIRESMYHPCSTICQSNGASSGNLHPLYDRKFTIAELKRICSFPDDFVLTGSYQKQWERLGRAVPPLMMYHISRTVRKEVLDKCQK